MNFLNTAIQMNLSKQLKRSGWVREKIKNSESIADHCFGITVLITLLSGHLNLNQEKMVKMALIHNFTAAVSEDIVAERGKTVLKRALKEKDKIQTEAMRSILWEYGEEYGSVLREMKERRSPEAKAFWQIDKLEMAVQAYAYEKEQKKNLDEFFVNASEYIKHPILRKAFNDLMDLRKRNFHSK